jgi:hypothetical protein
MPFMVIYRTSDGSSCHEQADAIDEAALFIERLRNKEGIDEIRIYRMEEISFAFRPYYKVELGLAERQSAPTPPSASTAVVIDPGAPEPPGTDEANGSQDHSADVRSDRTMGVELEHASSSDDGDSAAANGRRGLFGR